MTFKIDMFKFWKPFRSVLLTHPLLIFATRFLCAKTQMFAWTVIIIEVYWIFSLSPIQDILFATLIFLQLLCWFYFSLIKENGSEKLFQTLYIQILSQGWHFVFCVNRICFENESHVMDSLICSVKWVVFKTNNDKPVFLWNI